MIDKTGLAEGAKGIMERVDREKASLSAQEIIIDQSNKIAFPGFPYKFEAMWKKVIVSIDIFKSGYECRTCKGKKRIEIRCQCEDYDRPGFQYSTAMIYAFEQSLGPAASQGRREMVCPKCHGDYEVERKSEICSECKGQGALLHLPETSKNLPTTGVVVSVGCGIKLQPSGKTKYGYGIGDRVLFGPYAGSMIPTKAGILFKVLDANQIWAVVEGADELGRFDFVLQDNN